MPRMRPFLSIAALILWRCWREWLAAIRCSRRSSIHLIGRLNLQRGGADQNVFRVHLAADAETAADMALVELNLVGRRGRTSAPGDPGSSAAPWRRRAFPGCRWPRHSARWRRAFPSARRCGGRSTDRVRRYGRRRERRHRCRRISSRSPSSRSSVRRRMGPAAPAASRMTGSGSISSATRSAASSARYWSSAKTAATGSPI